MSKIHSHRYLVQILVEKKVTDKFIIIVPYEKNETAVNAEKAVMKGANHYLTSRNRLLLERSDFTLEYLETKQCDDLQSISIEKNGYAVIPFDLESDSTRKDMEL